MIKDINDYIPELQKKFPHIKKEDIKRMVEYGWRMFYFYNLRGCDTIINSTKYNFWMYCGQLNSDSLKYFEYYKTMLARKLRVLFIKKKLKWDGYYYIGISEEEYNKTFPKKGRPRKYFKYSSKTAFKIFGEAELYYSRAKYFIKFKYPVDMGWKFYKEVLEINNAEIVKITDNPLTFKDVLIQNNKYDIL